MITLRPHTSHDYSTLPDMDATDVAVLTDRDEQCLSDIGALLVRQDAHERFGISLLHSHFPVSDDEILVETADLARRTVSTRPRARRDLEEKNLVPLNLCFDSAAAPGSTPMVGLEYGMREEVGPSADLTARDVATLNGVRKILSKHDALRRFGVRLVHDAVGLSEEEALLESCDFESRSLDCAVTRNTDPQFVKSVQTFWAWKPAEPGDGRVAMQLCRRQCVKGCVMLPGGHQGGGHESGGHDRD